MAHPIVADFGILHSSGGPQRHARWSDRVLVANQDERRALDQADILTGKGPSKRKDFYYFTETRLHGIRYGDWKFLFKEQDKWFNGVQNNLTTPLITNLKVDPFERFHEARGFDEWQENRSWTLGPATAMVAAFMKSLQEYPSRAASFELDIDEMLRSAQQSGSR